MAQVLAILDFLAEGCQIIGFDWRYRYVNDSLLAYARRTREELIGKTLAEAYPGIESTAQYRMIERCMTNRTPERMVEEFRFPDGAIGLFEIRCVPVPEGTCILSWDITERRRVEEAHRQADEGLRVLIDGVKDYAIYTLDPRGRIMTWNTGAERLMGYGASEIIGEPVTRFIPPEGNTETYIESQLSRALAQGRDETQDWRVRKDGRRFFAQVITTPIYGANGDHAGFAKVTRDLTESRRLEEQLRQAQKLEAVGRLAAGVAHDFNNLLSVILSYAEFAIETLHDGAAPREDIEEIARAGKRGAELTAQLLAFSRQQVLQPRIVDLNESIEGMDKMLRRLLGEDVELHTVCSPGLWPVLVDPGQVEQIVMNLAVNSRDAMPKGGKLTIETANIDLDEAYARGHVGTKAGPHVMLAVSDTGTGMDAATRAQIFEPFFTTKAVGKGTGLGLSTVHGIVQQSGGSIWVYSEVGQGTTFKVFFPRTSTSQAAQPPVPSRTHHGSERILVVEDDAQVRQLLVEILGRHGYSTLVAASPAEAIQLVERDSGAIDLLVTDVVMPGMSGRDLAAQVSQLRPVIKVLYVSGYADNAIVDAGLLAAHEAFLQKPITPESLTRKVREALDAA